jgi:hypothetical protein
MPSDKDKLKKSLRRLESRESIDENDVSFQILRVASESSAYAQSGASSSFLKKLKKLSKSRVTRASSWKRFKQDYNDEIRRVAIAKENEYFNTFKIGCNGFLNVYVNTSVLDKEFVEKLPETIHIAGGTVRITKLKASEIDKLMGKIYNSIKMYSTGVSHRYTTRVNYEAIPMVMLSCTETPEAMYGQTVTNFHLKAYKVIRQSFAGNAWDVSGGLEAFEKGSGIGSRIMKTIEYLARLAGITAIHIDALDTAVSFYEKLGFTRGEESADTRDVFKMTKVVMLEGGAKKRSRSCSKKRNTTPTRKVTRNRCPLRRVGE